MVHDARRASETEEWWLEMASGSTALDARDERHRVISVRPKANRFGPGKHHISNHVETQGCQSVKLAEARRPVSEKGEICGSFARKPRDTTASGSSTLLPSAKRGIFHAFVQRIGPSRLRNGSIWAQLVRSTVIECKFLNRVWGQREMGRLEIRSD